jgi:hypothetical protein
LQASQEQQRLLRQQLVALAADNARLAVALAESALEQQQHERPLAGQGGMQEQQQKQRLQQEQQQQQRLQQEEQQEQRLQLLVGQLVSVRDQAAAAAALSEQQQRRIREQQEQLLELLQVMAALQQERAAALADKQQKQQQQQQQVDKSYSRGSAQQQQHGLQKRVSSASGQQPLPAAAAAAAAEEDVAKENARLRLVLAETMVAVRQLSAEREVLLEELVDRAVVEELDAKNRGLLQVRV